MFGLRKAICALIHSWISCGAKRMFGSKGVAAVLFAVVTLQQFVCCSWFAAAYLLGPCCFPKELLKVNLVFSPIIHFFLFDLSLKLIGNMVVTLAYACNLCLQLAAKFRNSGQTCVCANRIIVQEGIDGLNVQLHNSFRNV
ncbi:hypothetical protein HHK36_000627 [Tetracentron sinense]|uniref:Uncharacterized protein n=1 Tax=Tetracentron sinense TaxID=13715 RepID=A0A834ZRX1_TETSI|nr:hypothetical protein HHK36_000627 [Tetracentron sinense]